MSQDAKWHLNPSISVGSLLTIGVLIVSVVAGWVRIESLAEDTQRNLTRHESQDAHPIARQRYYDNQGKIHRNSTEIRILKEQFGDVDARTEEIDKRTIEMDKKLDRLINSQQ